MQILYTQTFLKDYALLQISFVTFGGTHRTSIIHGTATSSGLQTLHTLLGL